MINLSKESALKFEQLRLSMAYALGEYVSTSDMLAILSENKKLIIGTLELMDRLKKT